MKQQRETRFKPECRYSKDNSMTFEKLHKAWKNGETVTGVITFFDFEEKELHVDLGGGYFGKLSFDEVTIYKHTYYDDNPNVSKQVYALKDKTIRAKIIDMVDGRIQLSRRENMMETLATMMCSGTETVVYEAISSGTTTKGAFFDIGEGIIAYCLARNFSKVIISDIQKWCHKGDSQEVVIESFDVSNDYKITCSRKDVKDSRKYQNGDKLEVRVSSKITNTLGEITGYYVEVSQHLKGIMNVYHSSQIFEEAESVKAKIVSINSHNCHMILKLV